MYAKDSFKNNEEHINCFIWFDKSRYCHKKKKTKSLWNAYFMFDEAASWIGCCRSG